MNRPALLIPLFAAAALFFGWEAYRALTGPVLPDAAAPAGPVAGGTAAAAPDNAAPSDDGDYSFYAVVARPVFRPDRRPYQENAAALLPARSYEVELSRFVLLGVVINEAGMRAVISGKGARRPERYEVGVGEEIPGFVVKEVHADGVTLAADGREFLLPLYAGAPPPLAGGPPSGVPAGPPPAAPPSRPSAPGAPPAAVPPAPTAPGVSSGGPPPRTAPQGGRWPVYTAPGAPPAPAPPGTGGEKR